jgi:RNA polymerase sigma factor (sigma-70 family)
VSAVGTLPDIPQPGITPQYPSGRLGIETNPREQDQRIISGLRNCDPQVENEFVSDFGRRCSSFVRKSGIRHPDSEDITQEALLAAVLQIRSGAFREETALQSWVFSILRHKMADYWRRPNRTVSLDAMGRTDEITELPTIASASVEATVLAEQVLQQLRGRRCEIVVLSAVGGYTINQIAVRIGGSPGRVGALLADAKRTLRVALTSVGGASSTSALRVSGHSLASICAKHELPLAKNDREICFIGESGRPATSLQVPSLPSMSTLLRYRVVKSGRRLELPVRLEHRAVLGAIPN